MDFDYEYEQDRHLRSLQSHNAEDAALTAALNLRKCLRQRRILLVTNFAFTIILLLVILVLLRVF